MARAAAPCTLRPVYLTVTGGTGRYRDADGELTIVEGGDTGRFTIRLD